MDIAELELKVKEAAKRIKALKEERAVMLDELKLLREDNVRARKSLRDNEMLKAERQRVLKKLEKLQSRLETFKI